MTDPDTSTPVLLPEDALESALALIASAPTSASALTLYALVNTLEYPKAGCLFKLTKLWDMESAHRPIAYALMEAMARGTVGSARWRTAKARMDELVRG